ncbi:hypothetical protein ACEPAF_7143 [Sanghuangporus sanghuang]
MVVDVLHEWEVGIWPSILRHLVRILATYKDVDRVQVMNERVRFTPGFGESLRTYKGNLSEFNQMTGYNYKDVLQCALPIFDGLFDDLHESIVRSLIYQTVTMHSLSKLRIHIDATVAALHEEMQRFADSVRKFINETCKEFHTTELRSEIEKRLRRQARAKMTRTSGDSTNSKSSGRKKKFNANTAKFHVIGDYPRSIVERGSTDSYSTANGESEHKFTRNMYLRTNRVNYIEQVSQFQRRLDSMGRIDERDGNQRSEAAEADVQSTERLNPFMRDTSLDGDGDQKILENSRYSVAMKGSVTLDLPSWLTTYRFDPAVQNFHSDLKACLFSRLKGLDSADDDIQYSDSEKNDVVIKNNRLYCHPRITIKYTAYDMERETDSIGPQAVKNDIMVLARDREVIDNAESLFCDPGSAPARVDFLLERIRPSVFVRAKEGAEIVDDWESFYVNRFAERDLFMLFCGGGIRHTWKHNSSRANAVPADLYKMLGVASSDVDDVDEEEEVHEEMERSELRTNEDVVDSAEYVDSNWDGEESEESENEAMSDMDLD